jgi:DeoR/GlpR family transcriptional regulator of sugar metabolism
MVKAIREFVKQNGYAPTVRELVDILDLSHGTVQRELYALAKDGRISKTDRIARSIRVKE